MSTHVRVSEDVSKFLVSPTKKSPLVRVVENNIRSLPLQKFAIHPERIEDDIDDLLEEVVDEVAYRIVGDAAEKLIEAALKTEYDDTNPPAAYPEVEGLLEAVIDEDGEYVREPILDPITKARVINPNHISPYPMGENLMTSDTDDLTFEDYGNLDPVDAFDPTPKKEEQPMKEVPTRSINKEAPEWVKDESYANNRSGAEASKQAADKGTLQYLKSVEGRVLTVLEAAFSNDGQREAVKSLIKKEFRREIVELTVRERKSESQ